MGIRLLEPNKPYYRDCRSDLTALLHRAAGPEERICPGCHIPCATCGGTSCTCNCSPDCPEAPRQMSSDPENHPIEKNIVPMVYALHDLGVFEPCWSCEGHADASGRLRRPPQVWFYARSIVYPDLVSSCLAGLHHARELTQPWTVNVVCWDHEMPDTTFSIEPRLGLGDESRLDALRRDARTIGRSLVPLMDEHARRRLTRIEVALKSLPTR